MTPPDKREPGSDKPGIPSAVGKRAAALGGQIGFMTLFIILAAVFGGLWLDNLLGTKPLLTLTIVLGTVPVSLYLTYRMARRAVKDYEAEHKPANINNQPKEGDDTGG
jgi:hypothetical protein